MDKFEDMDEPVRVVRMQDIVKSNIFHQNLEKSLLKGLIIPIMIQK